jgi:hypothetical protein
VYRYVICRNSEGLDVVEAAYEAGAYDVVKYFAQRGHEGAMEILGIKVHIIAKLERHNDFIIKKSRLVSIDANEE